MQYRHAGQLFSCLFVFPVLDEPPYQLFPGIHTLNLRLLLLVHRQEGPGFDVHECSSHYQEFTCHLKVQVSHDVQVFEVLVGYLGDRNVVNVQLVLPDQVKQEIQWSLELLQLYPVTGQLAFFIVDGFFSPAHNRFTQLL